MLKLIWKFMAEAIVLVVMNVIDVIGILKADKCGFMSPTPLTRQHSLPMSWRIMRRILVNR